MNKADQREDREFSRLLQGAADVLCAGLPDRLLVSITDVALWYSWRAWSPAMTRYEFRVAMVGGNADVLLGRLRTPMSGPDFALSVIVEKLGREIDDQQVRHTIAERLGLVTLDGQCDDLPSDRMTIDRTLLRMLDSEGIDMCALAARFTGPDVSSFEHHDLDQILVSHDGHYFWIIHDGIGPPIITTCKVIGPAFYQGDELEVACTFPMSIALGAVERPLGTLVKTGLAEIDCRKIKQVEIDVHKRRWPPSDQPRTRIAIESDRVAIGDAIGLGRSAVTPEKCGGSGIT